MTPVQLMNVVAMLAALACAGVIGWAANGTNSNRKDR